MSDQKKTRENNIDEYVTSMKFFEENHNKNEESAKKDEHQDENMSGYEGRREERRKSLENAFMQTMDPFA